MTLTNQCGIPLHHQGVVGQYVRIVVDLFHGHCGSRDDGLRPEGGVVRGDKTLSERKAKKSVMQTHQDRRKCKKISTLYKYMEHTVIETLEHKDSTVYCKSLTGYYCMAANFRGVKSFQFSRAEHFAEINFADP